MQQSEALRDAELVLSLQENDGIRALLQIALVKWRTASTLPDLKSRMLLVSAAAGCCRGAVGAL